MKNNSTDKKFFVFISYNSKDEEWAKWLEHELDFYHLPSDLDPNEKTHHKEKIRDNLRDVFWDSRLAAGGLNDGIKSKLSCSTNLIVICSPNSANVKDHPWVNEEIKYFIELGRLDHIYPFIVDGKEPKEFFPPSLLNLPEDEERVGGNVKKDGKDLAFIKIVAGMLDVDVDVLWQHYEKEKAEQERKEREQKERLQTVVGHFIGEKAMELVESDDSYLAATLILEMHNSDMGKITPEVESALRGALICEKGILYEKSPIFCAALSPDGMRIASRSYDYIKIWSLQNGALLAHEKISNYGGVRKLHFISNGDKLISATTKGFEIRDGKTGEKLPGGWYWSSADRPKHRPFVVDFSVNTEETLIAVGLSIEIHVVNLHTYQKLQIIDDNIIPSFGERLLHSLSFSPNGKTIAFSFEYGGVWLYNLETHMCENIIETSTRTVIYSHKGEYILTLPVNGQIELRKAENPHELISYIPLNTSEISSVKFSLDDNFLIVASTFKNESKNSVVYLYDIDRGEFNSLSLHTGDIHSVASDISNSYFISASDDRTIRIWGPEKRKTIVKRLIANGERNHIMYFPNGETIVIASIKIPYLILQFRDALTLEKKSMDDLQLFTRNIDCMTISPDSKEIFLVDGYDSYLVELTPSIEIKKYEGKLNEYLGIAYRKGNSIIWVFKHNGIDDTGIDDTIIVKSDRGEILATIETNNSYKGWAMDQQCRFIVVHSRTGMITVYNLEDTNKKIELCKSSYNVGMCFSPDGKFFMVPLYDEYALGVWETDKWELLHSHIQAFNPYIDCSPNSKYLIGCSNPHEIIIWDIASGIAVDSIDVKGNVASVKFNPNGDSFAVLLTDGTLSIYPWLSVDELMVKAKERFCNRKLSDEEKAKYYL